MTRLLALALLVSALVGCGPASSQTADSSEERKAQIVANLKHEFPQIADLDVAIDTLTSVSEGMDEGSILIAGQAPQPFLISSDNSKMYLLASDAIDASRSTEELAAARSEADAAAATEARERGEALDAATTGLPVRGDADAPITIVEFSDFECPFCGRAHPVLERIVREFDGQVRMVFKQYPLSMHEYADDASRATIAAGNQGKFWEMHDTLFEHQTALTPSDIEGYAEELGLDMERFRADMEAEATQAIIDRDRALGQELGVNSTPTIFVNGRKFEEPLENLGQYITEELARQ